MRYVINMICDKYDMWYVKNMTCDVKWNDMILSDISFFYLVMTRSWALFLKHQVQTSWEMSTLLTETWNKQDESTLRNKEPGINQWLPLSFSMRYTLEARIQRQKGFCQLASGKVRKGRLRIRHNIQTPNVKNSRNFHYFNMSNKKWKGRRGKQMNQLWREHFNYHRCRISSINRMNIPKSSLYQCLNLTPNKKLPIDHHAS